MGRKVLIGMLLAALASPALAAHWMPASEFLRRAELLRAKGPLAIFSKDLKPLQTEAEAAGDQLHAEHAALVARRERTDYCPPHRKLLGPRELIEGLHAIPASELQRLDIKQAMHAILVRNYPCPR